MKQFRRLIDRLIWLSFAPILLALVLLSMLSRR